MLMPSFILSLGALLLTNALSVYFSPHVDTEMERDVLQPALFGGTFIFVGLAEMLSH